MFTEDVGLEPGSVVAELGGFPVKEVKFRRDMEKLRNSQQRDLTLHKVRMSILRINERNMLNKKSTDHSIMVMDVLFSSISTYLLIKLLNFFIKPILLIQKVG